MSAAFQKAAAARATSVAPITTVPICTMGVSLSRRRPGPLGKSGPGLAGGVTADQADAGTLGAAAAKSIVTSRTSIEVPGTLEPKRTVTPSSGWTRITRALPPSSSVAPDSKGR
ncbi:hypothetical protein SCALM49S_05430 [Streptomyces californicus]